ncbi:MAG: hypothetical protein JHC95_08635 [Solirubrobacteraceae bacterium]|nr:hypothetical protein [Solirubrobacteraceae bacterium]
MTTVRDDERLARAYGYPFRDASPREPTDQAPEPWPAQASAVVAFGANVTRDALRAKLGADADGIRILDATLHGVDAVYSAHVSPYGAIPATLHPSAGTRLDARLLVLDAGVLARLDETEPNYERVVVEPPAHVEPWGARTDRVEMYRSRHGPLLLGGAPRALEEIPAGGRVFTALSQHAVQTAARDLLEPEAELDAFVLAGALDVALRAERTAVLRGDRQPARRRRKRG